MRIKKLLCVKHAAWHGLSIPQSLPQYAEKGSGFAFMKPSSIFAFYIIFTAA